MGNITTDAKFHVLAVDDSIMDRKLIERLLKTSSYQVTLVDSGIKALQFLGLKDDEEKDPNLLTASATATHHHHQEMEVNLIITDYCMPEMTGYDLLKKIKESSSLKNIPVVIMSSENIPSRISRCLEEGAEDFFLKPVQLSDVSKLKPHLLRSKAKEPKSQGVVDTERTRTWKTGLEIGISVLSSSENLLKWKIHITVSIFFLLILLFSSCMTVAL